jgi:hypothetical protein
VHRSSPVQRPTNLVVITPSAPHWLPPVAHVLIAPRNLAAHRNSRLQVMLVKRKINGVLYERTMWRRTDDHDGSILIIARGATPWRLMRRVGANEAGRKFHCEGKICAGSATAAGVGGDPMLIPNPKNAGSEPLSCLAKDGLFAGVPASLAVGPISPFGPRISALVFELLLLRLGRAAIGSCQPAT